MLFFSSMHTHTQIYSPIPSMQNTLILVAILTSQSRWFFSTSIKFTTSVRKVFFVSPTVCTLVAFQGGPATSICQTSKPSETLVALASTSTIPELVDDFNIFAACACVSTHSKLTVPNVVS